MVMMKLCFAVLLILSVTACRETKKNKHTDTPTSGVVSIAADESFEPIVQQEIDVFEGIYQTAGIVPIFCSEVDAINLLLKDSVRMAVTTRKLSGEERRVFESRKFFPREIKIAVDGIALIVNKQNTDTLISVEELQKIMTGEITTWKELNSGSKLDDLQLVFDHPNSSTVRFAIDSICKGMKLSEALNAQDCNKGVIDFVEKTPGAMGVIGVSWLGECSDSTRLTFLKKIKVMGVSREYPATIADSYQPWQAYLALGVYPLTRDVYIILTDPRNGLSSGFTSFIASDKGQRIILKSGIVPATQPVRVVNVRENI